MTQLCSVQEKFFPIRWPALQFTYSLQISIYQLVPTELKVFSRKGEKAQVLYFAFFVRKLDRMLWGSCKALLDVCVERREG